MSEPGSGEALRQQRLEDQLSAAAQGEAVRHKADEVRGGCTCGFCVWSVEHVAIMSVREAARRVLPAAERDTLTMSATTFAAALAAACVATATEIATLVKGLRKAVANDETEWVDANIIRLLLDRYDTGRAGGSVPAPKQEKP